MTLYEKIISIYSTLTIDDFFPGKGTIIIQNDSDGKGDYIAKWEYSKPLPESLQSYLPA